MKLTPAMHDFILHWGEMGTRWGVTRTVAQVHALLYLSPEPLCADDIVETLGVARSNVSQTLKELGNWGLVKTTHVLGDRRDHFEAYKDNWYILRTIVDGRKKREIDPTRAMLANCVKELRPATDPVEREVNERIEGMLAFIDMLMGWYDQISTLPQDKLVKLIRTGNRVSKWLS